MNQQESIWYLSLFDSEYTPEDWAIIQRLRPSTQAGIGIDIQRQRTSGDNGDYNINRLCRREISPHVADIFRAGIDYA